MRVTMHMAKVKVGVLARADRTHKHHVPKPTVPSRQSFRARCSPSRHGVVAQSTRVIEDDIVVHLESDGGGRGGAKDCFYRWWNSDGT